jgi:acyl phosphate:glycerol-3-phosphate acyltransferase
MIIFINILIKSAIICLYSYLLGSIPFGKIFGKIKGKDVQKTSSGKIGATNVTRALGIKWGIATGILDAAKGAAAIIITEYFFPGPWITTWLPELFAGLSFFFVILGHVLPVWLKFKGGAGVSTFLGGLVGLIILGKINWWFLPVIILGWFFVLRFIARKQMSTANLLVVAGLLLFIIFIPALLAMGIFIGMIVLLIWWAHRQNLKRIRDGKEPSLRLSMLDKIPLMSRITDDGIGWLINRLEAFSKKIKNGRKKPE